MASLVETTHLRNKVSKFGGMVQEGTAVLIPPQTWDANEPKGPEGGVQTSFRTRHQPSHNTVRTGVPNSGAYLPHGGKPRSKFDQFNWTDRESPEKAASLKAPHAPDYRALDRSGMPQRMPVVGYAGHLRHTKTESFGTSHWRNEGPVTRARAAEIAKSSAEQRALSAARGMTPTEAAFHAKAMAQAAAEEHARAQMAELEAESQDAAEALELMQLRSMGIRGAMKVRYPED